MIKTPEIITVPLGAEINCGLSEDSDSVVVNIPTQLQKVGPKANGAVPVHIIDGPLVDRGRFYF